jgi:hypothetical protein
MRKHTLLPLLTLGAAAFAVYRTHRQIIGWLLRLPPARYRVGVQRDLRIPAHDDVAVLADHYFPKASGSFPTILIRSPYGRELEDAPLTLLYGFMVQRFAERGYHVIAQTTRGRYHSEGKFEAFTYEAGDGLATIDWIARQPWFDGHLGMWGSSYLGYTQWAAATQPQSAPHLIALMPILTSAQFYTPAYADGVFAFDSVLKWSLLLHVTGNKEKRSVDPADQARAFNHLPLREADLVAAGEPVPIYRDAIDHPAPDDPRWQPIDHRGRLDEVIAAVHLVSGWYDIMLRELLADYAALKAAGRAPHLTIGPWHHSDVRWVGEALRQGIDWFDAQLKGQRDQLRAQPVRLYIMSAKGGAWRDFDAWPPPPRATRYYLHSEQQLAATAVELLSQQPDHYRYDPADPTPSLGGPTLDGAGGTIVDNRPLEARPDVLIYTTAPLDQDVEVIGPVRLELYARSTLPHTDFFGRVCDVYPDGRSINICDGLIRVNNLARDSQPSQGLIHVEIDLWATAYRFVRGHRVRLQVSSGAHPRWARNLGTGEPIATGTQMLAADQTIYHDAEHPSALILPVIPDA